MHKQVRIKPNGGFGFDCDKEIADIIYTMNTNQIITNMSCQDFNGDAWFVFDDIDSVKKLHEIAKESELFAFLRRSAFVFGFIEDENSEISYGIWFSFPKEHLSLFKRLFFSVIPLKPFKIYEVRQVINMLRMHDEDY